MNIPAGKHRGYPELPIEPSAGAGRGVHRISPLMEARHSAALSPSCLSTEHMCTCWRVCWHGGMQLAVRDLLHRNP